jgi:ech hydrogenase subunit B
MMLEIVNYAVQVLLLLAIPLLGGLLMGIDRKITARMQSRIGPPVLQPFYDVIKLWGKKPFITSKVQPVLAFLYFGFSLMAMAILVFRLDLLILLFTVATADVCLIMASFNSKSPYSNLGGKRELLSMLSYEPLMILAVISIFFVTRSFMVEGIASMEKPLLLLLPGVFAAMEIVLIVETKKSPFDVSASSHAHQELVRGVYTEFSGYTMAVIEVGHWIRTMLILALIAYFWAPNLAIGGGLAFLLFFISILIDNVYPRLTWQKMLKTSWALGFALILINMAALFVLGVR